LVILSHFYVIYGSCSLCIELSPLILSLAKFAASRLTESDWDFAGPYFLKGLKVFKPPDFGELLFFRCSKITRKFVFFMPPFHFISTLFGWSMVDSRGKRNDLDLKYSICWKLIWSDSNFISTFSTLSTLKTHVYRSQST
jgi:hypothetical protein